MGSSNAIEQQQLQQKLNSAAELQWPSQPRGGWIRASRKALRMSGAALSARLGGSRTRAANLERYEQQESLSMRNLSEAAEAMGCKLVYAIVPASSKPGEAATIEQLINAQAEIKARELLAQASGHMALEAQQLSDVSTKAELQRLQNELLQEPPRNFWHPTDEALKK